MIIKNMKSKIIILTLFCSLTSCGDDSDDNPNTSQEQQNQRTQIVYDFSTIDVEIEDIINSISAMEGLSYIIVNSDGVIHKKMFGNHTEDTIFAVASSAKMPTAMTIMALHEDNNYQFSIREPISSYLQIDNLITEKTVESMLSQTSGLPGLFEYIGRVNEIVPNIEFNSIGNIITSVFNIVDSPNRIWQLFEDVHICQFFGSHPREYNPPIDLINTAYKIFVDILPGLPVSDWDSCGNQMLNAVHDDILPSGQTFRYGGSQWQIAGYTATQVTGKSWNELFDEYLGQPCQLEVSTYRNFWNNWTIDGLTQDIAGFDRVTVDSVGGQDNPNLEGGLITNIEDYGKLLQLHLNNGKCGDTQVLSTESILDMQKDRGGLVEDNPTPYGMGWFIDQERPNFYYDPGLFGSRSFIDTSLGIGAFIVVDDYSSISLQYRTPYSVVATVQSKILETIEQAQLIQQ